MNREPSPSHSLSKYPSRQLSSQCSVMGSFCESLKNEDFEEQASDLELNSLSIDNDHNDDGEQAAVECLRLPKNFTRGSYVPRRVSLDAVQQNIQQKQKQFNNSDLDIAIRPRRVPREVFVYSSVCSLIS